MPRDGTFPDLSSEALAKGEISLEERALRHALAFFTDEGKWHRGDLHGPNGSRCVGGALILAWRKLTGSNRGFSSYWLGPILGLRNGDGVGRWNDHTCPDFATMIAHLKSRIEFYQNERLKNSYIVVIGSGRQVKT